MISLVPYPKQFYSDDLETRIDIKSFHNCLICVGGECESGVNAVKNRLSDIATLVENKLNVTIEEGDHRFYAIFAKNILDKSKYNLEIDNPVGKKAQGYSLNIEQDRIVIVGNDRSGLFYGLTTLWQLCKSESADNIPLCTINDSPTIEIRGHFDDVSRKRISTVDDFKLIVKELGEYKINYYAMYLEDVLHLKAFTDIGRKRGKLMPWEVEEIVQEASDNNVEIIPFFQLLGHCENLLASPNYEHLGRRVKQSMSTLDPDNEEVRRFLSLCIKEVCEIYPCEYFGMGCDETQGVDADTYIKHLNWCAEELIKYGKKPLFWADMFYNHFGVERMADLHPAIIPINWQYGTEEDGSVMYQEYLEQSGKNIWGFGGYSNWCKYAPDFKEIKNHMDVWSENMAVRAEQRHSSQGNGEETALLYSQWGDDGYENNRDLIWPLIAYAAETSWRAGYEAEYEAEDVAGYEAGDADGCEETGNVRDILRATYDARFQMMFFGEKVPEVTRFYNELADQLKVPSRTYWNIHRKKASNVLRLTANDKEGMEKYAHDTQLVDEMLKRVYKEYKIGCENITAHGDMVYSHILNSLELLRLNADKMLMGYFINANTTDGAVSPSIYKNIHALVEEIREVRDHYITDWLINNRRECLNVSESVFDEVAASFEELIGTNEYAPLHYAMVDFSDSMNTYFDEICGVPIGRAMVEGVPFLFADETKTHIQMLKKGEKVASSTILSTNQDENVNDTMIADLNVIVSAPMNANLDEIPIVRVTVEDVNGTVKSEDMLLTKHLCDWWAPAGEHIWAGGGYKYVDKNRVSLSMKPDLYYGLCTVSGFSSFEGMGIPRKIEFEMLEDYEVNLFAATFKTR